MLAEHTQETEDDQIFAQFMENHHRDITNGRTIEHAFQRMCREIKNFSSWELTEFRNNHRIHNEYNRMLRRFNRLPKVA